MIDLLWFVSGAATATTVAALCWRRRVRRFAGELADLRRQQLVSSPPEPPPPPPAPEPEEMSARTVAIAVSDELASLATGVDGAAHELIECAPDRAKLPRAAEHFFGTVRRLRRLHDKLRAFGSDEGPAAGQVHIDDVVAELTDELQHLRLGLEVETCFASGLPPVALPRDVFYRILLFTCGAMLRHHRDATHLSILSELALGDDETALRIELMLEGPDGPRPSPTGTRRDPRIEVGIEAAIRLARRHGTEVTLSHPPGRPVKALIVLPSAAWAAADSAEAAFDPAPAASSETAPPQPPATPATPHHFGGALVVEADPAVRSMLARELRQAGRAVFSCADEAAARTFLDATPDRFELLFVDHVDRLDPGGELGRVVHGLTTPLKVCVLESPRAEVEQRWPGALCIEKPFAAHELRRALASVLSAG